MIGFVYSITMTLVFFPAIGFVCLKLTSDETKRLAPVRRAAVLFFILQILNFFLIAEMLLTGNGQNGEYVTLFSFLSLYAVDLISITTVFYLPESCHGDKIVARLLQIYLILFLILLVVGLMSAPLLRVITLFA